MPALRAGGGTGSPGSTTRCLSATRNSVEGETNTIAGVAAAVRELAMRAVDPAPVLDQIEDRLLLRRPAAGERHRQPAAPSSRLPVSRSR